MTVNEIGNQECSTSFFLRITEISKYHRNVSAGIFRMEIKKLTDNEKNVFPSFFGGNEFFYFIGKENHTNLVVVLNC